MTFEKLTRFIEEQNQWLIKHFGKNEDKERRVLSRTVKLTEELGELYNEVLGFFGNQRKEKLLLKKRKGLAEEFADVIITALLLAKSLGINIEKALEEKIKKLEKRR